MDTIYDIVRFAQETNYEDLPQEAIFSAKMLLADIIAASVAGTTADACKETANLMFDWGGKQESSVLVYDRKLPAPQAAFLNSLLAHARDYDEVQADAIVHTGVSIIPVALAVAEAVSGVSGKKVLSSIVLSDELFIRMGLSIKASIMESGWIYSPLLGHFASALCASLLMNATQDQTVNAIGIAYSQASGNQQASTDTALTKRMQPAFAARSGVFSAYLAKAGISGARNVLDGQYNFYRVYLQNKCDRDILTRDLGKTYWIPTLSWKPYPVCGLAISGASTVKALMDKWNINWKNITRIDLGVTQQTKAIVVFPEETKYDPRTVVDAQFSLPFAVAAMVVRGHLGLGDVTMEGIQDSNIRSVMSKIHVYIDENLEAKYARGVSPTRVTIHTTAGQFSDCLYPKGHPSNPFRWEDMCDKFMDALQYGVYPVKPSKAEMILNMIYHLEALEDITELIQVINHAFVRQ